MSTGDRLADGTPVTRAGFWRRLSGYLLDALVIAVGWIIVALLLAAAMGRSDELVLIAFLLALPVAAVLYGLVAGSARSLGSAAAGIRTVRYADGSRVGSWRGAGRMLAATLLLPFVVLVWIFSALNGTPPLAPDSNPTRRYVVIDTRVRADTATGG